MSEYKMVHDILQRIDDDLIEEAVSAKRTYYPIRRFVKAAAVILICAFLSVGVAAAISPDFREWMMEVQGEQLTLKEAFPEALEAEAYRCHVTYPGSEEVKEISLTEEEIEEVLDMIRNSESEVMSSDNGNMEYADKVGISIRLVADSKQYTYTYTLTVSEEDILTYSIEKKSLDSGDKTEKRYVIYSRELYDLVMDKTMGGK